MVRAATARTATARPRHLPTARTVMVRTATARPRHLHTARTATVRTATARPQPTRLPNLRTIHLTLGVPLQPQLTRPLKLRSIPQPQPMELPQSLPITHTTLQALVDLKLKTLLLLNMVVSANQAPIHLLTPSLSQRHHLQPVAMVVDSEALVASAASVDLAADSELDLAVDLEVDSAADSEVDSVMLTMSKMLTTIQTRMALKATLTLLKDHHHHPDLLAELENLKDLTLPDLTTRTGTRTPS